jgi:hypothetical protein
MPSPETILIENLLTPHYPDGGAGTTACGLLNGRPTAIVPFFGE